MATEPLALFVNPAAGRGRARQRLPRIRQIFEQAGLPLHVVASSGVGDLERLVAAAASAGSRRIVVAGGDGSVHEAVNGLLTGGAGTGLGLVPTGTGNDFAKACDIPLDWELAARQLAGRIADELPARPIDIGRMNSRYFANGAGIGFDAKVTQLARSLRWPRGDLVYLRAILRCMVTGIATPELSIHADGFDWSGAATLANVSNGPWIGGMFHIAPMASNSDGSLDLLIAAPVSRRRLCALLPGLLRGTHVSAREITHRRLQHLRITAAAPVPSHLDGEVQPPQSEFEFEILPGALRLL